MCRKFFMIMVVFLLVTGLFLPVVQAANASKDELIKVSVNVTIEDPEYFWQYPFWGKQLESIRISGMGNTITLNPQSGGQLVEYQVPKGYKFRVWLEFLNGNSTYKKLFLAKQDIDETNKTLNIVLKAPGKQAIIINSSDFDEKSNQLY